MCLVEVTGLFREAESRFAKCVTTVKKTSFLEKKGQGWGIK